MTNAAAGAGRTVPENAPARAVGDNVENLEIEAGGLTFSARAAGPAGGRPVILLHGFPQSSLSWHPLVAALGAAGYRAVAPDQRGYSAGARPKALDAYGLANLVGDVLALANTMEMTTFDLIGHDWGGMVAWVTAGRHPDRIRSLSVVSTPHPGALRSTLAQGDPDQVKRSGPVEFFRRAEEPEHLLMGEKGAGTGLRSLFSTTGLGAERANEYIAFMSRPGTLTAALNWYRAMKVTELEGLPPVVVPTLYVWSTGDAALGRRAAEATAEWVAGRYQFVVLDGVSHWIPEQAPDELGRLVSAHLASA